MTRKVSHQIGRGSATLTDLIHRCEIIRQDMIAHGGTQQKFVGPVLQFQYHVSYVSTLSVIETKVTAHIGCGAEGVKTIEQLLSELQRVRCEIRIRKDDYITVQRSVEFIYERGLNTLEEQDLKIAEAYAERIGYKVVPK